jgi:hypothetical protein
MAFEPGRLFGTRFAAGGFQRALREIDFLFAAPTVMDPVEFVGKYFIFDAAVGAFAGEGAEVFELFESRAMLRCGGHESSSLAKKC